MNSSMGRGVLCWIMVVCIPASVMASDAGAAMLYAKGVVTVDGNAVTDSSAVFPGNIIETKPDALANLNASGSTITLQPETLVKFEGSDLYLDHGSLTVASSGRMRVHVKCAIVTPNSAAWTQFEVADVNGTIQVVARKSDVGISYGSEFTLAKVSGSSAAADVLKPPITVTEGNQYNRYEREGCPTEGKRGGPSALSIPIQDLPAVRIGAAAAGGGILLWVLTRGGNTISPTNP